jgi:lipopolysaccharide transport system permease protein
MSLIGSVGIFSRLETKWTMLMRPIRSAKKGRHGDRKENAKLFSKINLRKPPKDIPLGSFGRSEQRIVDPDQSPLVDAGDPADRIFSPGRFPPAQAGDRVVPQETAEMSLTASTTPGVPESAPKGHHPDASPNASIAADSMPEFEIKARTGWVAVNWPELLHYRELLYFLIWRDVKVRYKQTVLGATWAIIQPLTTMLISTIIFGHVANMAAQMPQELRARGVPYCLFVYAGLLVWMFVSTGVSNGGMSLMNAQNLLTKVYFPRLFVPAAVIGTAMVDTLISFGVFFIIMAGFHIMPPWTVIFIPLLMLMTILTVLGISFSLAALTVTYRDFRFIVPFMIQAWMFISPVMYPLDSNIPWKHWLLALNPLFGIIRAYRSALLGQHWDLPALGIAAAETAVLTLFGLFYFKKTERRFADIA